MLSEMLHKYAKILDDIGIPSEEDKGGHDTSHLRWMISKLLSEGWNWDRDKQMRWVGYVQCMMVFWGFATLDEVKEDSRKYLK